MPDAPLAERRDHEVGPAVPDLFAESRHRWVVALPETHVAGNPGVADTADGEIRVPWATPPDPAVLAGIARLDLRPSDAQLRNGVPPPYLGALPHLRTLAVPAPLLAAALTVVTPPMLVITPGPATPTTRAGGRGTHAPVALPDGARGLLHLEPPALPALVSAAPGLRFLSTQLRPGVDTLIAGLAELRHLELIRLADLPPIPAPIEALALGGVRRGFPAGRLRTLETVTTLRLNGVHTELDCAEIAAMPGLRELTVLSSKRLTNVTALLGAPRLRSLTMVNCGRALRGPMDRFRAHGFDRLDVDYA
ncbi:MULTISPECIES: leucine-rich repeat domain-containing protein [Catenuloplanes]|uniref:Leucine-rich repeat domain-containing protein n=1 Tax=Catenuloplanes niger TaxID=587534 RepID=A0AAE3ZXH8_9ACTN|nr:hypothetical protein [Catenuloplanes niger]MDR7326660.1 hypothetical protein [Catenuloplanes niger]